MNLRLTTHSIKIIWLFGMFFLGLNSDIYAQDKNAIDTINFLIKHQKNHTQLCDDLYKIGNYYWNIGNSENAHLVMTRCKELAEQYHYEKGIYDAYAILGAIHLKNNDLSSVRSLANECLQLASKKKSEYGANRANYILLIMAFQQGQLDSVIAMSKRTLDAPHMLYDSINLPKFNVLLANAYLYKGNLYEANNRYLDALNIAELTNNEQLQSVCLGNLALINDELNNFQEALKYHYKSLPIQQRNNQIQSIAASYLGIGNIYHKLLNQDTAIYFYRNALSLYEQFDDAHSIALVHNGLGGAFLYANQPDSGMYYLLLAKEELTTNMDSLNMAENALKIAETLWKKAELTKDKSYLKKALSEIEIAIRIAEAKGYEDIKMRCYYQATLLYDDIGETKEAFNNLKKYNNINTVIRSKQYTMQIADMQTKYETEKKEKEITELNAQNLIGKEKIARQRTFNYSLIAIAALLLISGFLFFRNIRQKRTTEKHLDMLERQNAIESMRTKIASDVHDEMGANLTRLGLNAQQLLQSPLASEKDKQLAEKMANQSKDIITGMREIIWASNPANDNLKGMLSFMRQYIDHFFDGTNIRPIVNFPHDVGEVVLHPEVRRNLFLILKESLNNAIKYSGSDRIDIDFLSEKENFNLTIKDYGKGIDDQHKDAFSNGLHNMQMRAEQIQSLFSMTSTPGQGVEISVAGKLY